MSLTTLGFLLFVGLLVFIYYLIPKKFQWILLLIANIIFYCSFGMMVLGYIIATIITVFFAAGALQNLQKKDKKRKFILVMTIIFNFGLLAFVKYTNFLLENIDAIFNKICIPRVEILVPIGISFYTFQSVGYLLDVYWRRDTAEKNIFRFATFVSFFPQIIQGPISKHKDLGSQLSIYHKYDFYNIKYGIQLILWGYFKKLVIADSVGIAAGAVLDHPMEYKGFTVIVGILAYCVQLYCDFSGGIDVIRGVAQLFDIHLIDNFKRPFFSQSIAEFWRRWHITLGIWMKDYVFYPLALSKQMNKLGKKCQDIFGKTMGRKLPICLENLIIFFLVGIWHGASWHFIVYGLYNGFIIAISSLLEPVYKWLYQVTHIRKESTLMKIFRMFRTFLLVNIGWYFDDVSSLSNSLILIKNTFMKNITWFTAQGYLGLHKYQYAYIAFGCIILFVVSFMQEKGIEVRKKIDTLPFIIKLVIFLMLIFAIPLLGPDPRTGNEFMYANF